ncbi:MAG: sigma-70 family RNA polymerase sigma factor [Clostridia bacterium]|nr:sigma-70 family RNA polymerase sigma factor [Clostridia bacterium]
MSHKATNKGISELLKRIRSGEENAMEQLLCEYAPLIEAKTAEYGSILEEDDIRQLCAIGLFEAAQSYSEERARGKVTFGLYAKLCVRNRILSEVRKLGPAVEQVEEDTATDGSSMEEEIIRRQELASSLANARKRLTPYEDKVLRLYLKTGSYDSVARALGRTRKSVDNAMSRIRSKFRNLL